MWQHSADRYLSLLDVVIFITGHWILIKKYTLLFKEILQLKLLFCVLHLLSMLHWIRGKSNDTVGMC